MHVEYALVRSQLNEVQRDRLEAQQDQEYAAAQCRG